MKNKGTKKNKVKISGVVKIHINSSFNNTIISACQESGSVVAWASGGSAGFKNAKEATPSVAQTAAENLANKLKGMGVTEIKVLFKGMGSGRESVLKTMASHFKVLELRDITPIAYNGVRLPKRRRS